MNIRRPLNKTFGKVRLPVLLVLVIVPVAVIAAWLASSRHQETAPAPEPPPAAPVSAAPAPDTNTTHPETATTPAPPPPAPVAPVAPKPAPNKNANLPALTEATAYTRQMVADLAKLELNGGALTKEQAEDWKKRLQALKEQGAPGAAAIGEYLKQNLDVDFKGIDGGKDLGYSSLRLALINTMEQIGGADAIQLSLQTLENTTSPAEIATLAGYLASQPSSGQYQSQMLSAAEDTLNMARQGKLPDTDVAPLFEMMQHFGDQSVVPELVQNAPQWHYYATLALAQMNNGAGVSALAQMLSSPNDQNPNFTAQMLAQSAVQNQSAADALASLTKSEKISGEAWPQIAAALGGETVFLPTPVLDNTPAPDIPGARGFGLVYGNQHYESAPLADTWTTDQVAQSIKTIDSLIALNPNPDAVNLLQAAKAALPKGK